MSKVEMRIRVLLALQVALLGMVSVSMRTVLVSWTDKKIRVRIVFDRAVSSEDIERTSEIESEVMSHFPDHDVRCQAEACLLSAKVYVEPNEVMVFQRASEVV